MVEKSTILLEQSLKYAKRFVDALNSSVSHFHAIQYCSETLQKAGFKMLNESDNWKLEPNGKYFFTRNDSALFAFTIGGKVDLNNTLFKIIGTHTDSPNLRLAPNSYRKSGIFEKLNLQVYGGGLWHTWFDRDLSVCGKVIFKDKDNNNELKSKIIRVDETLFNIPNLAIHLSDDRKTFNWNNENHLKAILSMGLNTLPQFYDQDKSKKEEVKQEEIEKRLGNTLAKVLAKQVGTEKENIVDFELVLYDTQPSKLFGLNNEFIASGRLDNLGSTLIAVDAMTQTAENVSTQEFINVIALFDNEEVGSESAQGADSIVFANTLQRIFNTVQTEQKVEKDSFFSACKRSFALSADLAHATHPNYEEKHHPNHKIFMHQGVAIKTNINQRYATDGEGCAILREIAKSCDVPVQDFIVKQDSPCGTTIGPIMSAHLGIKTIDIGVGVFAMHSIRETGSSVDFYYYLTLMTQFFNENRKTYAINKKI